MSIKRETEMSTNSSLKNDLLHHEMDDNYNKNYNGNNINMKKEENINNDSIISKIKNYIIEHKENILLSLFLTLFFIINDVVYNELEDDWSTLDTIYFTVTSITTVGYGDFTPSTEGSRLYTILFLLVGLIVIFGTINDVICDYLENVEVAAIRFMNKNLFPHEESPETYWIWKQVYTFLLIMMVVLIGCFSFMSIEGYSFVESMYWAFVTTFTGKK